MKKLYLFFIFFIFIVNSCLFAFENDLYKVNDNGWTNKKEGEFLVFTLENSKEFIDPETKQTSISDIYILIRTLDFEEFSTEDYSPKNVEKFKTLFQEHLTNSIKSQKEEILDNMLKKFPGTNKSYIEKKLDKMYERTKLNSCTVRKLGKFQSFYLDFYDDNFNVIYYSLYTLNHRYQIQLYYHKDVDENNLKPAYDFVNSFEPKDVAPTAMNRFIYGNGLKIVIFVLLIIALVAYKLITKSRNM